MRRTVRSRSVLSTSLLTLAAGALTASACSSDPGGTPGGGTPLPEGGAGQDASFDGSSAPPGVDAGPDAPPVPTIPPVDIDHACGAGLAVHVTVLDDASVRVHWIKDGKPAADRGWIVDRSRFAGPTRADVKDAAGALDVTTAALTLSVRGDACALSVHASDGAVLWDQAGPFAKDATGAVTLGRKLQDGEKIYGLGEKTGVAARRGRKFTMWNSDPAWSDPTGQYLPTTDPIYQSHPFFVSVLPGGHTSAAFLANTYQTTFDVGATKPDVLALGARAGDADVYLFDGPSPHDVLDRYTRLVGRPYLPPMWTMGYHQSRWSYTPQARVEEVALGFRQRGLPIDGMWLDIDYMDGFRDFTWNKSTFADAAGMLQRLAGHGFKVTTIVDPGVKSDPKAGYSAYDDGVAKKVFITADDGTPITRNCWPGAAVFPDFSSSDARAWWGARLGAFMSAGVRGTWIDMNEPAVFVKEGFPLDAKVSGDGMPTTFDEIKNVYAFLMAKATFEGQASAFPDRRPFVLTRAGFAGIQRYAAVWTGDAQSTWDHLAMAPAMLQGMGVSGISFVGSDIGGFTGSPSPELYGRWFELGSLSPFFRSHVQTGTPDQEPWSFGAEVEDAASRMLALRYALLPYWYDAFVEASKTGAPILRPLWFEAPADDEAFKHEDEVWIGGSILAAPVTAANVATRAVYLPKGTFYDLYTGAAFTGPQTLQAAAPLGRVPMFVRAGSVIPEQELVQYVGESPGAKRFVDVYPGPPGTASTTVVTDDDGETMGYAHGDVATTALSLAVNDTGLKLTLGGRQGTYVPPAHATDLRVHGVSSAPASASIDGAQVAVAYDASTRIATIALPDVAAAHAVTLAYDAKTLPPVRQTTVDFTVTLPSNTPAGDVYVASNVGGWQPNGLKLARNGTTATGSLPAQEGMLVKYKVTRGTWATVEVDGACASLANRTVAAGGGKTAVAVGVAHWGDACP